MIATSIVAAYGGGRETEFYVLMLLASLGTTVLGGATDLVVLQVGLLLASIPLSGLIGWAGRPVAALGLASGAGDLFTGRLAVH